MDDLATSLQSVNIVEDGVDFSPDPPKEAEGETTSNQQPSEPKEPDVSPATDNPPAAEPMTAADPPPTDDAAASQATDYIPPSKRVTSLSTNQPLEPLEAIDGDAAAPTPIKPTSKAAAIGKVSKRKRDFLVPGGGPTSGGEMPPPTLEVFLRGTRPKSKPAPKTSRNDQKARDESPSKKAQQDAIWAGCGIAERAVFLWADQATAKGFLRCTHANAIRWLQEAHGSPSNGITTIGRLER